MRAKVVEAEATVPMAISEAFRNGNLGVMDYAKYQNVIADTKMLFYQNLFALNHK
jgi:uncharacterized protein YqfA (UPF0365 family)